MRDLMIGEMLRDARGSCKTIGQLVAVTVTGQEIERAYRCLDALAVRQALQGLCRAMGWPWSGYMVKCTLPWGGRHNHPGRAHVRLG